MSLRLCAILLGTVGLLAVAGCGCHKQHVRTSSCCPAPAPPCCNGPAGPVTTVPPTTAMAPPPVVNPYYR